MRFKLIMSVKFLMLLFAMMSLKPSSGISIIEDVVDIIKLIQEVSEGVQIVWNLIDNAPVDTSKLPIVLDKHGEVMRRMDELNDHIQHSEKLQAEYFAMTIETLKHEFHTESLLTHKLSEIEDMTKVIAKHYRYMTEVQNFTDKLDAFTLNNFAEWCVKPGSNSLGYLTDALHSNIFGEPEDKSESSLFAQMMANYEKDESQICTAERSPQQYAYDLFTKLMLTELKAYLMMEFSWMTLRESGKGNFTLEMSLMRRNYQERITHSKQVLLDVMTRIGRVYWRCDPMNWQSKLGVSYDQVTRLLQGYVENEVNLNNDSSCFQTCEDYTDVRSQGCIANELCTKQPRCEGRLHSCQFIGADMTVCQSNATSNITSSRRYDYIQFNNGRRLGQDGIEVETVCATGGDLAESWSKWIFWRCNYCFCLCDEESLLSDRYFNLRDTLSDYQRNMVVTGARFVKAQRVFHLQLQQGELLPGGLVNQSSLAWIPLELYDVSNVDIRNGYDYHKLNYNSRAMDLDEIAVDNDTLVVTGARFHVLNNHLNLEVRFSTFNFTTGHLIRPDVDSIWLGNDWRKEHQDKPRQKLMLYDPQVSTKSALHSLPLSKDNQYMEFVSSSVDKDAAQSTVPFIDLQDVVPNPAVSLSGLGIYHKGRRGFGGFFAPKVVTYNFWEKLLAP
ncbi:uncharacterized protein LOC132788962 [Drosophila nasuta]|uniref:uncharacterized protein LOC132788962 n=1 Tax=Drosophila nasuta TaxID=42062 RepID=UPI00295E2292|nr:uncharacterized protein LOC132788962 [Drosophila nasuta]